MKNEIKRQTYRRKDDIEKNNILLLINENIKSIDIKIKDIQETQKFHGKLIAGDPTSPDGSIKIGLVGELEKHKNWIQYHEKKHIESKKTHWQIITLIISIGGLITAIFKYL